MVNTCSRWGSRSARVAACAAALLASASCFAMDRSFPPEATYCVATSNALPNASTAVVGGATVALSAGLIIRDQSNRIIVNSYLPQAFHGMCVFGASGALEKIWILTREQAIAAKEAAKAKAAAAAAAGS